MSQISVHDLTFYYEGSYEHIFENISFRIDTDWKLGLVGRNGRGKTTLLRLLMGEYEYRGSIRTSVLFDYFPFMIKNPEKNTIDVIEEADPGYELWKICRELTLLEVDIEVLYRSFQTLSNGEQTKVLLAVLFAKENHFLLIDEPTNHLDMNTRMVVMEYLKKKKGFILVSHDQYFLDGCVDHILAINKTDIEVVQGNFSCWWEQKKRVDTEELAENEKLKKNIKRLENAAERTQRWSDAVEKTKKGKKASGSKPDRGYIGHKAAKMMKRSIVIENRANAAVEEKKQLLKNIETAEDLKLIPLQHRKTTLVKLEDAEILYEEKEVLRHFSMRIEQGERVALCGKNGCGKSSVIKAILGEVPLTSGKIELAGGLVISYISQDTSYLRGTLGEFAEQYGLEECLFKALLRKLDFSRTQFEKRIEDYSAGQKKKVLLAKSLCEKAHLYIWDEPLNYIDIFSRMQIEDLIGTFSPTMLFVEHDRFFLEKIATKRIMF